MKKQSISRIMGWAMATAGCLMMASCGSTRGYMGVENDQYVGPGRLHTTYQVGGPQYYSNGYYGGQYYGDKHNKKEYKKWKKAQKKEYKKWKKAQKKHNKHHR